MAGDDADRRAMPIYHLITPGDHFSPRTGSAIPTVVHGLAGGAVLAGDAERFPQRVVLQEDTWQPRYASAEAVTYPGVPAPGLVARRLDAVLGRMGAPRPAVAAYHEPAVRALRDQPAGIVLAHNSPIVPYLMRDQHHATVLYAHNDVLRSYSVAESSRLLGDSSLIVSVSDALGEQLRRHLPRSLHGRVRTVLNGVDTSLFRPAAVTTSDRLRVMFLGRTIADKGADILLRAAAMLDRTDLELVIVGSTGFDPRAPLTPYERGLRELADAIGGRVEFEPFVERDALPTLLGRADVLVVPSRWPDPCPLTIGEGMAMGLPVVAARVGGIPELLGDAGVLFDPAHPEQLAAALDDLASDPAARRERAAASLARATAHDWAWSWRRLATVLEDVPLG